MISYLIYGLYNLIYQAVSIFFLFYASTYLNDIFIPDSLRWKDGKLQEDLTNYTIAHVVILIIETVLLMLLMYYINKWFLSNVAKTRNSIKTSMWTAGIYLVITLALIAITTYSNFK